MPKQHSDLYSELTKNNVLDHEALKSKITGHRIGFSEKSVATIPSQKSELIRQLSRRGLKSELNENFQYIQNNFGHAEIKPIPVSAKSGLSNSPRQSTEQETDLLSYSQIADLIREHSDAQLGIVSSLEGDRWVRDATAQGKPIESISRVAVIEGDNTILRMLSRLRPIDFHIQHLSEFNQACLDELKIELAENMCRILAIAQMDQLSEEDKLTNFKKIETNFNTFLIQKLHENQLTQGIYTKEDAEKLLFHYRNMSSVLEPARTLVTITYDEKAKVLQRDTQYPLTKKTQAQKDEILKLKSVIPFPVQSEQSAHSNLNQAMQEVDQVFADKIAADDTLLPAQTRKTHLTSLKNAYLVCSELVFGAERADLNFFANPLKTKEQLWLARSASPVYVGKGETAQTIQAQAIENIEQIRAGAQALMDNSNLKIHLTSLNTNTRVGHQDLIIKTLEAATKQQGDAFSNVPTNFHGRWEDNKLSPLVKDKISPSKAHMIEDISHRLHQAAEVLVAAAESENVLSVVQCASGQDRTGVAVEYAIQEWTRKAYQNHNIEPLEELEIVRARGSNAAEIASHLVQGSRGIKQTSKPGSLFNPRVDKYFFLGSADTNKKNKVDKSVIDDLNHPSDAAKKEYQKKLSAFKASFHNLTDQASTNQKQFNESCQSLVAFVEKAHQANPNAKELYILTQILSCATQTLSDIEDIERTKINVERLTILSQQSALFPNQTLWKNISMALLVVGAAALICIGILSFIPTAGFGLMLALLVTTLGSTAASHVIESNLPKNPISVFTRASNQHAKERQQSDQEPPTQSKKSD